MNIIRLRTLAFYFAEEAGASSALHSLRTDEIGEPNGELAPLVVDGVEGTILALSVDAGRRPAVERVARRHGGRLVADVPQEWTRPPLAPPLTPSVRQRTDTLP